MDSFKKYSELIFVLTLGTGAGISVESKYVNKLPKVNSKIEVIHKNYVPVPKRDRKEYTELLQKSANVLEIVVGDSKFGWSKAVELYFDIVTSKQYQDIEFILLNYDSVRPAGERLKTFGGFASGHTALSIMFDKINKIVRDKQKQSGLMWNKLKTVDCLDVSTIIAENVVSGGTRRSAEIIFCDPTDDEVINAKGNIYYQNSTGDWITNTAIEHRTLSNNTVLYEERPSRQKLNELFQQMIASGEPAIGNLAEMRRRRPDAQGTNPSMPKDVLVQTTEGIFNINMLEDKKFFVRTLDGEIAPAECWLSSENAEVFEINYGGMRKTYATGKHKFPIITPNGIVRKMVNEIQKGDKVPLNLNELQGFSSNYTYEDGLLAGLVIGDGSLSKHINGGHYCGGFTCNTADVEIKEFIDNQHLEKTGEKLVWHKRDEFSNSEETNFKATFIKYLVEDIGLKLSAEGKALPSTVWSSGDDFALGLIDGLFSADGHVNKITESTKNARVTLTTSIEMLAVDVQKLLSFYGVSAALKVETKSDVIFPNGKIYDRDYTRYDLRINGSQVDRFANIFHLISARKQERLSNLIGLSNLNRDYVVVESVKSRSFEPVWDITVHHDTHAFPSQHAYTGNCGEILLRDRGVCNLTEVNVFGFVREDGTLDRAGVLRAQELSARMGYRMATIELELHEWNIVNEEDRLVGTSLTGIMDAFNALKYDNEQIAELLRELKEHSVEGANSLADYLGLNRPKLATTVKPSGTISQLPTVSSGMHYSHSPYYIRRIRVGKNDPIVQAMTEMGFTYIEESMSKLVYEFPVKAPEGKTKYDVSAIEQLEMYKLFMENYTQHNCFTRDTKFITDKGIKSFNNFEDGDYVNVLAGDGAWSKSKVVKSPYKQKVMELTLRQNGNKNDKNDVKIKATENHRWLINKRSIPRQKTTDTLIVGDKIYPNYLDIAIDFSKEAIKHGIVYGDGSARFSEDKTKQYGQLYLCGGKRELKKHFKGCKITERDDINQSRLYKGINPEWKKLPVTKNPEYILGFIMGLIATDGSVGNNGAVSISTSDKACVEWLKKYSCIVGFSLTNVYIAEGKGFTKEGINYIVNFSKSAFKKEYFLNTKHKNNFEPPVFTKMWDVVNIEEVEELQEVWCVEEPRVNQFTLEHNILTYNCSNTIHVRPHEWKEVEEWVYNNWDSLVGVTFLSLDDSFYPLMPYESITKEQYEEMAAKTPKFNPNILTKYEKFDAEEVELESDCEAGVCPVR